MELPLARPIAAEDLTLRTWDNDESVLADLVSGLAGPIERAISKLPGMAAIAEDIVAEAVVRFWKGRHQYDGKQPLGAYLYTIARNVASEYSSGRLRWQKSRRLERELGDGATHIALPKRDADPTLDDVERQHGAMLEALRKVVNALEPLLRDILESYANAGDYEVNAGELGRELGLRHNDGVPYPAGTIRVYKSRAKKKIDLEMRKLGFTLSSAGVHT